MTDLLELALNDLVPFFADETPDWPDVIARSRPPHSPRRVGRRWRRHPHRAVALAFALLLIVLLATPAFGIQGYVLQLLERKDVSFSNSPAASNVVKKQFFDLPLGAPPNMAPQVKAAQTRFVATFSIAGHLHKLFVAPTRQGGYCYLFENYFGGCRQNHVDRRIGEHGQFGATWTGPAPRLHLNDSIVTRIGGDLTTPNAWKITARYADGTTADIPFVWVSAPIAAGFFSYDIPATHWNRQHRLVSVTLYGREGKRLGQQTFPYAEHPRPVRFPPHIGTPNARALPVAPPVAPSAPTQTGIADGFKVVVGHNGQVQFTQVAETPILKELVGKSAGFSCFRLTTEFGIFTTRGLGEGGRFASKVGLSLSGVGTPVDGCEVQASIGHRWPDRLHNRAAVEIPLTAKGRAFFADRAAARDLALFVRTRRVQQLRKKPAAQAKADLLNAYGRQLAQSPITITVVDTATLRLTERSTTGKLFTVTVHRGRIANQNVKPYALVF